MSGDSESLLVREGVGYKEIFPSGHGPEEGLSQSSKRETSAYSPVDEEEKEVEERGEDNEYDESEGENEGELEGEDDEDEDESDRGASVSGSPGEGHTRPFILPKM